MGTEWKMSDAWRAASLAEWTYARPEGDLIVFAESKEEALLTIRQHGFLIVYPDNLRRTGRNLAEHLAGDTTEREPIL